MPQRFLRFCTSPPPITAVLNPPRIPGALPALLKKTLPAKSLLAPIPHRFRQKILAK